jgi:hypothetical protein
MSKKHYYNAYNLSLESPFPIKELVKIEAQKTDIIIFEQPVFDTLPHFTHQANHFGVDMLLQVNGKNLLIVIKDIAKFYIENAEIIHIERQESVSDEDVTLYLLGTCLACLNMLRGVFALHGSAIDTAQGSVLFIGNSGVGKSTTAAKMIAKGYKLQADDVSFIIFDADHKPWVYPAYPQLKLWDTSVEKLGIEKQDLEYVSPLWQKFRVSNALNFQAEPRPLFRIYELKPSENVQIEVKTLHKFDKIKVLFENTFRNYMIQVLQLEKEHFEFSAKLATSVTLKYVTRPKKAFLIDELTDLIEADFDNL